MKDPNLAKDIDGTASWHVQSQGGPWSPEEGEGVRDFGGSCRKFFSTMGGVSAVCLTAFLLAIGAGSFPASAASNAPAAFPWYVWFRRHCCNPNLTQHHHPTTV